MARSSCPRCCNPIWRHQIDRRAFVTDGPGAAHLRGATRILVVPDGAISSVPLAALPAGESSYLLEQWAPISYLSTERDLLVMTVPVQTGARGILAVERAGAWKGFEIRADAYPSW